MLLQLDQVISRTAIEKFQASGSLETSITVSHCCNCSQVSLLFLFALSFFLSFRSVGQSSSQPYQSDLYYFCEPAEWIFKQFQNIDSIEIHNKNLEIKSPRLVKVISDSVLKVCFEVAKFTSRCIPVFFLSFYLCASC